MVGGRGRLISEFEASLVYRVSSRFQDSQGYTEKCCLKKKIWPSHYNIHQFCWEEGRHGDRYLINRPTNTQIGIKRTQSFFLFFFLFFSFLFFSFLSLSLFLSSFFLSFLLSLFLSFFFFFFFETGFLCTACPELTFRPDWPQIQKSTCLYLPDAGIKALHHHHPAKRTQWIGMVVWSGCVWWCGRETAFCFRVSFQSRPLSAFWGNSVLTRCLFYGSFDFYFTFSFDFILLYLLARKNYWLLCLPNPLGPRHMVSLRQALSLFFSLSAAVNEGVYQNYLKHHHICYSPPPPSPPHLPKLSGNIFYL